MIDSEYDAFVLVNQDEAQGIARDSAELNTDTRLLLAALGRMNDDGHAVFIDGELRDILGKIDRRTGEKTPVSRQSVYAAKVKLFEAGLLEEYSGGETCVWINARTATRKKSGRVCPIHRRGERRPFYARNQVGYPFVKNHDSSQADIAIAQA